MTSWIQGIEISLEQSGILSEDHVRGFCRVECRTLVQKHPKTKAPFHLQRIFNANAPSTPDLPSESNYQSDPTTCAMQGCLKRVIWLIIGSETHRWSHSVPVGIPTMAILWSSGKTAIEMPTEVGKATLKLHQNHQLLCIPVNNDGVSTKPEAQDAPAPHQPEQQQLLGGRPFSPPSPPRWLLLRRFLQLELQLDRLRLAAPQAPFLPLRPKPNRDPSEPSADASR